MIAILQPLIHEHDAGIVSLAALLCGCGVWVTTELFNRVLISPPNRKARWLLKSSLIAGTTIWCTHSITMLGYRPGVAVGFSFGLTALSLLIALAGSLCSLAIAGWRWNSIPVRLLSGTIMGLGITAVHYVGIMAYQVQGSMAWSVPCLVLSVVLAMALAAGAFLAGGEADRQIRHTAVMKGSQSIGQQADRLEKIIDQDRHENIEFKITLRGGHTDRGIIGDHLNRDHGDGLRLRGIDFSRHDRTARFRARSAARHTPAATFSQTP